MSNHNSGSEKDNDYDTLISTNVKNKYEQFGEL